MKTTLFFILCLTVFSVQARADHCLSANADLSHCHMDVNSIHPAQTSIGLYSIRYKVGKIEKEYAEGDLTKYLIEKTNPAVLGPNKKVWILDGHHFNYALKLANIPVEKKKSYMRVLADFSDKSSQEFEAFMLANNYVYLKDQNFNLIAFKDLPDHLSKMKKNPYRALAWIAKKRGFFAKSNAPFMDFLWAEYYQNQGIILESPMNIQMIESLLPEILRLSRAREASHLPGYIQANESHQKHL